jgi:FixJ family two-component response regulator
LFEKNADAIALVLLDVVMPNLGGQAAFEGMLAIRPQIPALFTSGYSENAMHTHFVLQEGFQMIQKPYARVTLLKKIREILDNNKATPA